jgi:hypothetical protein
MTTRTSTWGIGLLALSTLALSANGCRSDDDGGDLIINTGGGSTTPPPGSPPPTNYTVVYTDPAGGTIEESDDGSRRRIVGTFESDYTLEASYEWLINGPVFFGDDAAATTPTMTIEAGTTLHGRGGTPPSMIVIRRGAKIDAQGTAADPIVFTSAQPAGLRAPGDWGGLIINGRAPSNEIGSGGQLPVGEGGSGEYGGTIPDDDSGTLRYVRVEFAGHVFTSDDELNGIAFQGVGSGTTVEYVQVHRNADDGVEFFGGTVNVKRLLITGCLDDSMDWMGGWTGKAQFVVLQQWSGGADNGIEADNLEADNDASPRSHPQISNMTIVGPADAIEASDIGLQLRRGTGANLHNLIVLGMNEHALDIDNDATWNHAYTDGTYTTLTGNLTLENSILFGNAVGDFVDDAGDPQTDTEFNNDQAVPNLLTDPQLTAPQDEQSPNFLPQAGSPALTTGWDDPGDPFFEAVTFIGAMGTTDWTATWTTDAAD